MTLQTEILDELLNKNPNEPARRGELLLLRMEMKSGFETVRQEMSHGFERLEKRLDGHDAEFKVIRGLIEGNSSDISGLKSDVSVLKSDVSVLKSDVSVLKSDVSDLKHMTRAIAEQVAILVERSVN